MIGNRSAICFVVVAAMMIPKRVNGELYTVEDTSTASQSTFPVSAVDLVNQRTATFLSLVDDGYEAETLNSYGPITRLNDGDVGGDTGFKPNPTGVLDENGIFSVLFNLDTSVSPLGYDVTSIQTFAGHFDNRKSQAYELFISKLGDATFVSVGTFGLLFNNWNSGCSRLTIANLGGGALDSGSVVATGVDAIRFDVSVPTDGYGTVYREFDVFGNSTASAVPEPTSLILWASLGIMGLLGVRHCKCKQSA